MYIIASCLFTGLVVHKIIWKFMKTLTEADIDWAGGVTVTTTLSATL